ncbi:unnamed protein product [Leptosia nina]|uniref:DUF4708 domain-containing protein n=1 Tax=Leptosia nina TaxID=320188 RepID=A0AAV1JNM5_9NEOP
MTKNYVYSIIKPDYSSLGYVIATANVDDKHDRSAPSDFHWKILKCRMVIFSHPSILASPDKSDVKKVHIIFSRRGDDFDCINSLFLKFSLVQEGLIRNVDNDTYKMCFFYTMAAKLAPAWNLLSCSYFVNKRDFLTRIGPQEGVQCFCSVNNDTIMLELKPVKINLLRSDNKFYPGECIRVLPSLNKANIEEFYESLPKMGDFKNFKDMRRHWKNIHGYRLPEEERPYYAVRFWRGEPLTYPDICLTRTFPIITPVPKASEECILKNFINCLKTKMPLILGLPIDINETESQMIHKNVKDTQAISLCTPTQN